MGRQRRTRFRRKLDSLVCRWLVNRPQGYLWIDVISIVQNTLNCSHEKSCVGCRRDTIDHEAYLNILCVFACVFMPFACACVPDHTI